MPKENYFSEYKSIGRNIKKIRQVQHLTQHELCQKAGISISYLSKIEAQNCDKSFSLDTLFRIADVLQIDVKELFEKLEES